MTTRRKPVAAPRRRPSSRRPQGVFQFLVTLANTEPLVWRRILVPAAYSFWDLHVAIQDAMGWQDCHLHEFSVVDPRRGALVRIGLPGEEFGGEKPCEPGWQVGIADYFGYGAPPAAYWYDFGDDWRHSVTFEAAGPAEPGTRYPLCLAGARRCPPEDCGGPSGYLDFLEAIGDPRHEEHAAMLEWAGGDFDPDAFDPARIVFTNPAERLRSALDE